MRKVIFGSLFVIIILLGIGNLSLKADQGPPKWEDNSTIPTRTPIPEPTDPPSDKNNPPPATNTPTALPTATDTPTSLPPTPVGGYLATAEPCAEQATILALNPNFINVRSGPGTDYDIVGQLVYGEVRLIIGRAGEAAWWLIQLPDEQSGWVANEVVLVHGNPANVPTVPAPLLAGATVTPGTLWQPTPSPNCQTPTAVPTITPSAEPATEEVVVEPLATLTATSEENYPAPATEQPIENGEASETALPTVTTTPITLATSAAVPPPSSSDSSGNTAALSGNSGNSVPSFDASSFLLFGAGLMIILGMVVIFFRRRTI